MCEGGYGAARALSLCLQACLLGNATDCGKTKTDKNGSILQSSFRGT